MLACLLPMWSMYSAANSFLSYFIPMTADMVCVSFASIFDSKNAIRGNNLVYIFKTLIQIYLDLEVFNWNLVFNIVWLTWFWVCVVKQPNSKYFPNVRSKNKIHFMFYSVLGRLSFSPRTHEHCSQEMIGVTGNLDGNLFKISVLITTLTIFN